MKKNSFIDGAIIGTVSLIICKILGLIYVIPFYKIIGTEGGALYSYAYSIYAMFLNLSTIGIPSAIAKIISEYDTLGYQSSKIHAYKIASRLLNFVGLISFSIMFIFANSIAESIIGGVEGGNSVESVATAIRVVSTALLVVPRLSIVKGYFQGNKYITESSISAVIEQFIRIVVIIAGSYITVKVFNLPVEFAVYIATFGATVGAFSAFVYLKLKSRPLIKKEESVKKKVEEKELTTKVILKKIIIYAIPFVLMAVLQSLYNIVDTFTLVKTLTSLGYETSVAETTIGVMTTWGSKLNMIVISISIGLTGSLIPNVVGSYTKGNYKDINEKLLLSYKMLLYTTIPMAFGISFLSEVVWHVFYGIDTLSVNIFTIYILQVIVYGLFTTTTTITQSMNQTKITIGCLFTSFLLKFGLNIPMMRLFKNIGIPSYYAPTIVDAIAISLALLLALIILKKKFKFEYKELFPFITKVLIGNIAMLIVLMLLKYVYYSNASVLTAIITIIIYTSIGSLVYFFITTKFKLLEEIFGINYKDKILRRLKIKK